MRARRPVSAGRSHIQQQAAILPSSATPVANILIANYSVLIAKNQAMNRKIACSIITKQQFVNFVRETAIHGQSVLVSASLLDRARLALIIFPIHRKTIRGIITNVTTLKAVLIIIVIITIIIKTIIITIKALEITTVIPTTIMMNAQTIIPVGSPKNAILHRTIKAWLSRV